MRARLQIDDEILWVVKCDHHANADGRIGPHITVLRGQEGTTAAAHEVGATYTWLPPEAA